MKKIIILIIMLFPLMVNANIKVTSHLIDAEIEIGGGLNVKEALIVEGEAESFFRTLNYYSFGDKHWKNRDEINLNDGIIYNASGISIDGVSVYELSDNEDIEFGSFNKNIKNYFKSFDIKNPSENTYILNDNKNGLATLKINYSFKNKKYVVYLNYIITNLAVKHNDVKELNYTFKNLNYNSPETLFRVIIPYQTQDELYHFWVHGNQSGKLQEIVLENGDKAGIFASFPKVSNINFRMTLPQNQIGVDLYLNRTNMDALDKIIEIENERLAQTNKSNNIIKIMNYALLSLGGLYVIVSFFIYKNNNKILYITYIAFGLFICVFNYLFRFNYWYLYLVILLPIFIKLAKKYFVK